jgi:hypothetical protein
MRIEAPTEAAAQALQDRVHSALIAGSPAYARSVAAGQTLRWAYPMRDGGAWSILLKDRALFALTPGERAAVKE